MYRDEDGDLLYVGKAKSLRVAGRLVRPCRARHNLERRTADSCCASRRGDDRDRAPSSRRCSSSRTSSRRTGRSSTCGCATTSRTPTSRSRCATLPAGDVHARAAPAGRPLLRAVPQRVQGARDARHAQPRLPVPALRGARAGPSLGRAVPRLPHRTLRRALRRPRDRGAVRAADRPGRGVPRGPHRARRRRLRQEMRDAAADQRYEDAARARNRLAAVATLEERQLVDKPGIGDVDVLGVAREGDRRWCSSSRCAAGGSGSGSRSRWRTRRGRRSTTSSRRSSPSATTTRARRCRR